MTWPTIVKLPASQTVAPNLDDYARVRAAFSWAAARAELDGLPTGRGLNIAYEAVDRHAAGGRGDHLGLRSSELSDPTITVTSLGEQGVESVFGIIYPPQVAIVGFGRIVERPWSVDGGRSSPGRLSPRPFRPTTVSPTVIAEAASSRRWTVSCRSLRGYDAG